MKEALTVSSRVGDEFTLSEVRLSLELAKIQAAKYAEDTAHKDRCGGGPYKAVARLKEIEAFLNLGL